MLHALCRQRVPPPPVAVRPESGHGKGDELEMRIVSPFSDTPNDKTLGPDERQAFSSTKDSGGCRKGTGGTSEGNDEAGGNVKDNARPTAWGHERVVRVPKETARWVFTNQPQPEDAITMKVSRGCLFVLFVDRPFASSSLLFIMNDLRPVVFIQRVLFYWRVPPTHYRAMQTSTVP